MSSSRKRSYLVAYLNLALPLLLVGAPAAAEAANYSFTDLGTLGGASIYSVATAINNKGQVVGYSWSTGYATQNAMLWNGTVATDLGAQTGSDHSSARGINDNGVVVGTSGYYNPLATVWSGGIAAKLGLETGWDESSGLDINNSGTVVGWSTIGGLGNKATAWTGITPTMGTLNSQYWAINNSGQMAGVSGGTVGHATLWDGTTVTDLGSLGGSNSVSVGLGINDLKQVVGWSATANGSDHAALWRPASTAVDLGTLGGDNSAAFAINESGQVVGRSNLTAGSSSTHAMLWDGTSLADLNDLIDSAAKSDGWVLVDAQDINDKGWIVGQAYNSKTHVWHAYLLSDGAASTVPEPASIVLAGLGLAGIVLNRRRKGR